MSNKKSNRVPTEQQKYRIFKDITEPALLAKNKPEEVSDIVKAIKEALGVKPPPVGNTTKIDEVFGNEDVALQQRVIKEENAIKRKNRKEKYEKIAQQKNKDKASSALTKALNQSLSVKKDNANVKLYDKNGKVKGITTSTALVEKLAQTKPLLNENDKRIGIDPQSYFKGKPTTQERAQKQAIKEKRAQLSGASTFTENFSIFD